MHMTAPVVGAFTGDTSGWPERRSGVEEVGGQFAPGVGFFLPGAPLGWLVRYIDGLEVI